MLASKKSDDQDYQRQDKVHGRDIITSKPYIVFEIIGLKTGNRREEVHKLVNSTLSVRDTCHVREESENSAGARDFSNEDVIVSTDYACNMQGHVFESGACDAVATSS